MKALLSHIGAWAPMAEQKAVAKYLFQQEDVDRYLVKFKAALEERLHRIYDGFIKLKDKGYGVDAVTPQAAIYLTVKLDLAGKIYEGNKLENQSDITDYILREAKLAVVPFYAFGAGRQSPWYRLSVGTIKLEEVEEMFSELERALENLA